MVTRIYTGHQARRTNLMSHSGIWMESGLGTHCGIEAVNISSPDHNGHELLKEQRADSQAGKWTSN